MAQPFNPNVPQPFNPTVYTPPAFDPNANPPPAFYPPPAIDPNVYSNPYAPPSPSTNHGDMARRNRSKDCEPAAEA
ncbi:hypothetical protein AgCh_019525 [Apium graveolens]